MNKQSNKIFIYKAFIHNSIPSAIITPAKKLRVKILAFFERQTVDLYKPDQTIQYIQTNLYVGPTTYHNLLRSIGNHQIEAFIGMVQANS